LPRFTRFFVSHLCCTFVHSRGLHTRRWLLCCRYAFSPHPVPVCITPLGSPRLPAHRTHLTRYTHVYLHALPHHTFFTMRLPVRLVVRYTTIDTFSRTHRTHHLLRSCYPVPTHAPRFLLHLDHTLCLHTRFPVLPVGLHHLPVCYSPSTVYLYIGLRTTGFHTGFLEHTVTFHSSHTSSHPGTPFHTTTLQFQFYHRSLPFGISTHTDAVLSPRALPFFVPFTRFRLNRNVWLFLPVLVYRTVSHAVLG